jgi:hypothetical protein
MAQATSSYPAYHDSQGKQTNPTTSTSLADTGAMPSALYEVRVLVGASVASTFNVLHRNAADSGNISDTVMIRAAAGQTAEYVFKYSINTNERIRVVPETSITGDAEATVQAIREA